MKNYLLLFTLLTFQLMHAQEPSCNDGLDGDGDGLIDCADPDCAASQLCELAIPCNEESKFYQVLFGNSFVSYDPNGDSFEEIHVNNYTINAIGYNIQDGFIYGIRSTPFSQSTHLVRVGNNGVFTDLGAIAGLPSPGSTVYYAGDCDAEGNFFITHGQINRIYKINIASQSVVQVYTQPNILAGFADITYLAPADDITNGRFYNLYGFNGALRVFDPVSGNITELGTLNPPLSCGLDYGASFSDADGFLYFFCNADGNLYRVDPVSLESVLIRETGRTNVAPNDGTSCPLARVCQESSVIEISQTICSGQSYAGHTQSGIYQDTFQSSISCDSIVLLNLVVNPNSADTIYQSFCNETFIEFNGQQIFGAGVYFDTLENNLGCDSLLSLIVMGNPSPFLGNDTILCSSGVLNLSSPAENSRWSTGYFGQSIQVQESGIYWASYLDEDACLRTDSIRVDFPASSYLPNAFSPNNDGINDYFQVSTSPSNRDELIQLRIYDRWGNQLFQSSSVQPKWDGKAPTGRACQVGVYVYEVITNSLDCGPIRRTGDVLLVR